MNYINLPEKWNDWTLTEQTGQGSSGSVYLALRRTGEVIEKSAIKIIHVSAENDEKAALFSLFGRIDAAKKYAKELLQAHLTEIRIMETLKENPHIVQIQDYDIQESPDHMSYTVFIKMEYLQTLEEHLGQIYASYSNLPQMPEDNNPPQMPEEYIDEIRALGCDICDALDACHKHNIIHRDIKPANIFWSEKDGYKLGDFDAACIKGEPLDTDTSTGTLLYMSPEIFKREPFDHTSDLYSLGILMYKYLNNNLIPFITETDSSNIHQVRKAFELRMSGKELPLPYYKGAITSPVMTACRFCPDQRFQSAMIFKDALL
ncbi:MAG: serine/threonine protein kinase [Blautia sp.]|nr:serine/threonine protein kinase [Blautia sp.]